MPSYKHPCPQCEQLISGDANACPYCGADHPFSPIRCPECNKVVELDYKLCDNCGIPLRCACGTRIKAEWYACPKCGVMLHCPSCKAAIRSQQDICWQCGQPLHCQHCHAAVIPTSQHRCVQCHTSLKKQKPTPREMGMPR